MTAHPSDGSGRPSRHPRMRRIMRRGGTLAAVVAIASAAGLAHGSGRDVIVFDTGDGHSHAHGASMSSGAVTQSRGTCPGRPRFNSVIDTSGGASFFYRPARGQSIVGAHAQSASRIRALLRTPQGRAKLPRIEVTTDRRVDARRLPWFATKVGSHRVVTAILSDAHNASYSGVRLTYAPRAGTYAKLILPSGTVKTSGAGCGRVKGYPTIYAQNIHRTAPSGGARPPKSSTVTPVPTATSPSSTDAATPTTPEPGVDTGPAYRLVLGIPSDQQEPGGAVAAIRAEAGEVTAWFRSQSANGAEPRWIRDGAGRIDVRVVRLPKTTAEYNAGDQRPVLSDVKAASRATSGVVADVVWINAGTPANHPCGIATSYRIGEGPWTPEGAVLWQTACDITPSAAARWPDGGTYLLAHEMTHLFGAVRECAPHHDGTGHVTGSMNDVLNIEGVDWTDIRLDPGYDDYLYTGNDCDIATSPMWTVTPTRPGT